MFLLWFHQEGGIRGKIYTTHCWIINWKRGGKTWQIREMKNDSVRGGSHPGIIGREDGGRPSTGTTTDVTLLWPRSEPASTLSLLGHLVQISVTNNRDNIYNTSRETEHSQLINPSSTVLPRQYVQYAFMQSQNFQARTLGCLFCLVQSQNFKSLASLC